MHVIKGYHTQEYRKVILTQPLLSEGFQQWMGNGFYFWQDLEFAEWWGETQKCFKKNSSQQYVIYQSDLICEEENFIDAVFNEIDYYNFVAKIEKFAAQ